MTRPVNNFGDLIGPVIVDGVRRHLGQSERAAGSTRLLSVGSVLHFARDGDVVWGSGVNGKVDPALHEFTRLDVRAVRGPLTHDFLRERGMDPGPVPYGDPALLLGLVRPDLLSVPKTFDLTVVPNLNDAGLRGRGGDVLDPRSPLEHCLTRIARSRLVVGSSLHGIVVAEALGIPARVVRSREESELKYADYFRGTGRDDFRIADDVKHALELGGEPKLRWDARALIDAFPRDLWIDEP